MDIKDFHAQVKVLLKRRASDEETAYLISELAIRFASAFYDKTRKEILDHEEQSRTHQEL